MVNSKIHNTAEKFLVPGTQHAKGRPRQEAEVPGQEGAQLVPQEGAEVPSRVNRSD